MQLRLPKKHYIGYTPNVSKNELAESVAARALRSRKLDVSKDIVWITGVMGSWKIQLAVKVAEKYPQRYMSIFRSLYFCWHCIDRYIKLYLGYLLSADKDKGLDGFRMKDFGL